MSTVMLLLVIFISLYIILFLGTFKFLPSWASTTQILQKNITGKLNKIEKDLINLQSSFRPLRVLKNISEFSQGYINTRSFLLTLSRILDTEKSDVLTLYPIKEISPTIGLGYKEEALLRHLEIIKLVKNVLTLLKATIYSFILKISLIIIRYQIFQLKRKPIILQDDAHKLQTAINNQINIIQEKKQSWTHLPKWVKKLKDYQSKISNLSMHLYTHDVLFNKSIKDLRELEKNLDALLSHIQTVLAVQPYFDKLQEIRNSALNKKLVDDLLNLFTISAENEALQLKENSDDYNLSRLKKRANNILLNYHSSLKDFNRKAEIRHAELQNALNEINKIINLKREHFVVQINSLLEVYPLTRNELSALSDWLATSENLPSIANENIELLNSQFNEVQTISSDVKKEIEAIATEGEDWTYAKQSTEQLANTVLSTEKLKGDFFVIGDINSAYNYINNIKIRLADTKKELVTVKKNLTRIIEIYQGIVELSSKLNTSEWKSKSIAVTQIIRRISSKIKTAKDLEEYDFVINMLNDCEKELIEFITNLTRGEPMKKGDTYYNYGKAANVGPGGKNNVYNEIIDNIEIQLPLLADDLKILLSEVGQIPEKKDHAESVGALVSAEIEARNGNKLQTFKHLAKVGSWVLEVAKSIGVPLAVKAIERAIEF